MSCLVYGLPFTEVDPRGRTFDADDARAAVTSLVTAASGGDQTSVSLVPGWDRDRLEAAITSVLVDCFGPWAAGFSWTATEPGGGGPVHEYCCSGHSLLPDGDRDAQASVERVLAALEDFRLFLLELVTRFELLHHATALMSTERSVEHAAAQLLPFVVQRTDSQDAWSSTFAIILTWYLESTGRDRARIESVVAQTISGRFDSWVAPTSTLGAAAATALGHAVAAAEESAALKTVDAVTEWASIRGAAFRSATYPYSIPVVWDGHRRYIERVEVNRDPERAGRLICALESCRASAHRGDVLTFDLLASWQSIVLGCDAPFREADAIAKQGRERYPIDSSTRKMFDGYLIEANDSTQSVYARATRAYLDICFTHPFNDGNARAARLALDFVLFREGFLLRAVEPIFVVSRASNDIDGARSLAWLVGYFAGQVE